MTKCDKDDKLRKDLSKQVNLILKRNSHLMISKVVILKNLSSQAIKIESDITIGR